jgi:hypothetical protein
MNFDEVVAEIIERRRCRMVLHQNESSPLPTDRIWSLQELVGLLEQETATAAA